MSVSHRNCELSQVVIIDWLAALGGGQTFGRRAIDNGTGGSKALLIWVKRKGAMKLERVVLFGWQCGCAAQREAEDEEIDKCCDGHDGVEVYRVYRPRLLWGIFELCLRWMLTGVGNAHFMHGGPKVL